MKHGRRLFLTLGRRRLLCAEGEGVGARTDNFHVSGLTIKLSPFACKEITQILTASHLLPGIVNKTWREHSIQKLTCPPPRKKFRWNTSAPKTTYGSSPVRRRICRGLCTIGYCNECSTIVFTVTWTALCWQLTL